MAMVTEVSHTHLRLSLPHGMEELVPAIETSDILNALMEEGSSETEDQVLKKLHGAPRPLTELFIPGQYVFGTYCTKTTTGEEESIHFSLRLHFFYDKIALSKLPEGTIVAGCVRSIEDHGCRISFGTKGVSGFLKFTEMEAHYGKGVSLWPGQLLNCVIKSPSTGGLIQLGIDPEAVRNNMVIEGGSVDPQIAPPGALIHATVMQIADCGLLLTVMGNQKGVISIFHFPEDDVVDGWQEKFCEGQMVKARVLGWNPLRSMYLLSLKPFLVQLTLPRMPAVIGQVFEDAKVQRRDLGGLSVKLPTKPMPTLAYVFASSLGDLPVQSHDFKLHQQVTVRVTGFHALDGLVVGTMKESVIRSGIVCFDDISPGMVGEGALVRVFDDHVFVAMGEGIEGCARQCGRSTNISLRKFFNEGQLVSYRVLKLKRSTHQVTVSLDAKLVHTSLPFPSSWSDAEVGMRVIGCVMAVRMDAVIVSFAGEVHGVLPVTNVKLNAAESLPDIFQKNQIVKPWILKCHAQKKKIFLTLVKSQITQITSRKTREEHPFKELCKAPDTVHVGDVGEAIVEKVMRKNGGLLARVTVAESGAECRVLVPPGHLSDQLWLDPLLAGAIRAGSAIGSVVILETAEGVRASRKMTLVRNAMRLPSKISDVVENMLLHGYVSFVGTDFLNVSFLGGLTGRVFRNQLPVPDLIPSQQFCIGQSVHVRVVKVDLDRERMTLTLNPSRTTPLDTTFLQDAFTDLHTLHALNSTIQQVPRTQIGDIIDVTIRVIEKEEVKCSALNHEGVVPAYHFGAKQPEVGAEMKACLLDVTSQGHLVLSFKPYLLEKGFRNVKKRKKNQALDSKNQAAVVELVADRYVVVSLPDDDHSIAMASTSDYNLQRFQLSRAFQPGQHIQVEGSVDRTSAGCPIVSIQLPSLLWKREIKLGISDQQPSANAAKPSPSIQLQIGDIVAGVVDAIREGGVSVKLTTEPFTQIHATVPFIDLFDHFTDQVPSVLHSGQRIKGVVTKCTTAKEAQLSLRESDGGKLDAEVTYMETLCPVHLSREEIERGSQMWGYVSGHGKNTICLFVNIARNMYATVYPPHLGDDLVHDAVRDFPVGSLVKGTVISCNYPRVGLSLRSGEKPLATVGDVVDGTVANILPQGIYVSLAGSDLQGLVPRYDLEQGSSKGMQTGHKVRVEISPLTDAFHLVLRLVHDEDAMEAEDNDALEAVQEIPPEPEEVDDTEFELAAAAAVQDERSAPTDNFFDSSAVEEAHAGLSKEERMEIWGENDAEMNALTMEKDQEQPVVEVKAESVGEMTEDPKSNDDFERLLFSYPNSAYLWVRFMASFLEAGDVSKAKATAERALETIDYRHEKERLDVWLAYLNMERTRGGTTESVMALFQRAVLSNDPKGLHLSFLKILETSKQIEIGDLVLKSMHRRCPSSAKVYLQEMHYWLSTGRGANCKRTLGMAMKNLPKRKHVKVIQQAGILEFKIGRVERGRDIFEGLLSCYPKRMDVWNVYLDQEIAQDDVEHTRALFERASSAGGSRKSMKWIFKRYLQFEMEHGSQKTVEDVKNKAKEYVARKNDS